MSGEKDLSALLARMTPQLRAKEYVFCSLPVSRGEGLASQAVGYFREDEGVSLVLERAVADRALVAYQDVWKMISLKVHSSLEAVGFLSALTAELASAGIPTNVISAYYHDHLFVPAPLADKALAVLLSLQSRPQEKRAK